MELFLVLEILYELEGQGATPPFFKLLWTSKAMASY